MCPQPESRSAAIVHDAAADRQRWRACVVQIHPPERPQYRRAVSEITLVGAAVRGAAGVSVCPGCGRRALSTGGQVQARRMVSGVVLPGVAW